MADNHGLPAFLMLVMGAWVLAVVQLLSVYSPAGLTLPDADDALRLVQVREFLGGKGWFDLHETRLAPPVGYDLAMTATGPA